jgi:hypothetical protein
MLDEYGFPSVDPELRVCAACFDDQGLKNYVNAHGRRSGGASLWRANEDFLVLAV